MRRKTNLYYEQLPDLHAFHELYGKNIDQYFINAMDFMSTDERRAFETLYLGKNCSIKRFIAKHEDADFRTHIPRAEMSAALESLTTMEWILSAFSSSMQNPAAA